MTTLRTINITLSFIADIVAEILSGRGITVDLQHNADRLGYQHGVRSGYMVSIPGHEVKVPFVDVSIRVVTEYIIQHGESLTNDQRYLGAWLDAGQVYFDVSVNFSDRDTALEMGRRWGQKAIWDVVNCQAIEVE
jgi:hypothetical protein